MTEDTYYIELEEWCFKLTKNADIFIYGHDVECKLPEGVQPGSEMAMKDYGKLFSVHKNRIGSSTLAVVSLWKIEPTTLFIRALEATTLFIRS